MHDDQFIGWAFIMTETKRGLSPIQAFTKRTFDFLLSFIGLLFLWPVILVSWLVASWDTKSNGFFMQQRVGRNGRLFRVIKIRSMRVDSKLTTTVTTRSDPRITPIGAWMRRLKLDELPQLINVFLGQMSFVGPRPDVPGFADRLQGEDQIVLELRPGITGPATLRYRDEESLLAAQKDPEAYNREVIWPDKVRINREYAANYSLFGDIHWIWITVAGGQAGA